MDQTLEAVGAAPVVDGHLQGVDREVGAQRPRRLPPDDHAGANVDDERDVHPTSVGLHVCEVGYPQPIGRRRSELALNQVSGPIERIIAGGGADP